MVTKSPCRRGNSSPVVEQYPRKGNLIEMDALKVHPNTL
jgi:hypothetical protein